MAPLTSLLLQPMVLDNPFLQLMTDVLLGVSSQILSRLIVSLIICWWFHLMEIHQVFCQYSAILDICA